MNAPPPKSNARQRTTLATCSGAHVLHDGLTDVVYVLLPVIAKSFGLSYAQVGLVLSVNKAALALFQLPAGLLAERVGERILLALGTACAGLGFLLLGAAGGFTAILVALAIAGIGGAVQHPVCSSLVSNAWPGAGRRIALGTYNFAGDVGKVAVASLFGVLVAAGVGWQVPATALGILAVACALAFFVLLHLAASGERPARSHPDAAAPRARGDWGLRNREGFMALSVIEVVDSSMRSAFLTFVAFLMLAKGLPAGWALRAVPVAAAGGMVGKLACGYLAERVGPVRAILITHSASALGILALVWLPGMAAWVLLPLVGMALNGTSSALYGTVGDLVEPERRARAFGLFYAIGSACGVIAPLAYGLLADRLDVQAAMVAIACVTLAGLPATLWLKHALGRVAPLPA